MPTKALPRFATFADGRCVGVVIPTLDAAMLRERYESGRFWLLCWLHRRRASPPGPVIRIQFSLGCFAPEIAVGMALAPGRQPGSAPLAVLAVSKWFLPPAALATILPGSDGSNPGDVIHLQEPGDCRWRMEEQLSAYLYP